MPQKTNAATDKIADKIADVNPSTTVNAPEVEVEDPPPGVVGSGITAIGALVTGASVVIVMLATSDCAAGSSFSFLVMVSENLIGESAPPDAAAVLSVCSAAAIDAAGAVTVNWELTPSSDDISMGC